MTVFAVAGAAVVMIVAVLLIVLALVYYLVSTIVQLRRIASGLDEVIAGVGEIVEKSAPVNDVVNAINEQLDAGVDLLEGLLVKKAGLRDAMGLIDGVYPGAGADGLRELPRERRHRRAAHRRGLYEGHAHARAARPGGADRRPQPDGRGAAGTSRAAAWRRACSIPTSATPARRSCRAPR